MWMRNRNPVLESRADDKVYRRDRVARIPSWKFGSDESPENLRHRWDPQRYYYYTHCTYKQFLTNIIWTENVSMLSIYELPTTVGISYKVNSHRAIRRWIKFKASSRAVVQLVHFYIYRGPVLANANFVEIRNDFGKIRPTKRERHTGRSLKASDLSHSDIPLHSLELKIIIITRVQ